MLRSFLSISMLTLALGSLVGCAADGSSSAEEPSSATASELHAGSVSLSDFETFLKGEQDWVDNAAGCTFTSKRSAGGLSLTLTADGTTVKLDVGPHSVLKHSTSAEGAETYTISGVGSVESMHADDAFARFTVTSAMTHKSSVCEVDT
jgi:hypothetical protein